jgi:transposase
MKTFKPYHPNQSYLLPPDMKDWLPEGHLALFVSDVVDQMDLGLICASYESERGQPPYHPAMMLKLLVYAYCTGKPSSRKIEKATWEDVAYRVLSADQHPDHDSIAEYRRRHLSVLSSFFLQVLKLCRKAGLVKLGHVALDGTKIKANASKHKAMSYDRMGTKEKELEKEIEELLKEAEHIDGSEDARFGKGKRGDEIPEELRRRQSRLVKIREAKAALEEEAKQAAAEKEREALAAIAARERKEQETGKKTGGRKHQVPVPDNAVPEPKAQKSFTDPESRIMKDGATKEFVQAYNAQIVVDSQAQIIVVASVTQEENDKQQLIPMMAKTKEILGHLPDKVSADAGYFSEAAVTDKSLADTDLFIPPHRVKHGENPPVSNSITSTVADTMRRKLSTREGKDIYRFRKAIVEPVFGQIKEVRNFRRFSFRGLAKVEAEWTLICLTHNLLKLFRSGWSLQAVGAME